MSKEKVGALLIFERSMPLDEYFKTGTIIDAKVTDQLLRNLFFKNSPLHDGAVIVRGSRVAAAGCVMPLSENTHLPGGIGTRHLAPQTRGKRLTNELISEPETKSSPVKSWFMNHFKTRQEQNEKK